MKLIMTVLLFYSALSTTAFSMSCESIYTLNFYKNIDSRDKFTKFLLDEIFSMSSLGLRQYADAPISVVSQRILKSEYAANNYLVNNVARVESMKILVAELYNAKMTYRSSTAHEKTIEEYILYKLATSKHNNGLVETIEVVETKTSTRESVEEGMSIAQLLFKYGVDVETFHSKYNGDIKALKEAFAKREEGTSDSKADYDTILKNVNLKFTKLGLSKNTVLELNRILVILETEKIQLDTKSKLKNVIIEVVNSIDLSTLTYFHHNHHFFSNFNLSLSVLKSAIITNHYLYYPTPIKTNLAYLELDSLISIMLKERITTLGRSQIFTKTDPNDLADLMNVYRLKYPNLGI